MLGSSRAAPAADNPKADWCSARCEAGGARRLPPTGNSVPRRLRPGLRTARRVPILSSRQFPEGAACSSTANYPEWWRSCSRITRFFCSIAAWTGPHRCDQLSSMHDPRFRDEKKSAGGPTTAMPRTRRERKRTIGNIGNLPPRRQQHLFRSKPGGALRM